MVHEESGLFQVKITTEGEKFIRKFAAISYLLLILVLFENGIAIHWNIKSLIARANTVDPGYLNGPYYRLIPYMLILSSLLSVVSNIYYLRFPRLLLRSIETNDEPGANRSFGILVKGAFIFLFLLIISTATTIWSLIIQ